MAMSSCGDSISTGAPGAVCFQNGRKFRMLPRGPQRRDLVLHFEESMEGAIEFLVLQRHFHESTLHWSERRLSFIKSRLQITSSGEF